MAHLGRGLPALKVHRHGLEKELFEQDYPNPYEGPGPQVLWTGNRSFDHDFLRRAAWLFPSWRFHLAGLVDPGESPPNIEHHGVLSVAQTLPLLKHASIGLACYRPHPGGEFLTDSLKIIQYTYCRLPIVAPDFVAPAANHFCHYKPGDDASIRSALERAATYDRNAISRDSIRSWDDLALVLAGEKG